MGSQRDGSVPTIYVLSKNKKNIKNFLLKNFNFYNMKKLHGHVLVIILIKNRVSGHVRYVSFGVSFHDRKETASSNFGILASQLTNFRLFTHRNIQH